MSMKVGTLCWIIKAPRYPHLIGRVARITAPLELRCPDPTFYAAMAYEVEVDGVGTFTAVPSTLLPFSDPWETRPEFKPERISA